MKPRQFQAVDVAMPQAGDDQILVHLEKVVVCGSDVPKFTGVWRGLRYPLPPGMPIHECVGTVTDSHSPRFQVGDRVVAVPHGDQGLAEYYIADAIKAAAIPGALGDSDARLLIQPLSTVIYALDRLDDVAGQTAVVVGLGPIGLLTTWLLHKYGVHVTGVDPISWRCSAAHRLGAASTFDLHSERLVSHIAQGGVWEAADICVEAVGQQTRTINDCLYLVKRGGCVLALGIPLDPVYAFDYTRFFRQNLQMIASVTPPDETYMVRAAELVTRHEQELAFLITHSFPLERAAEAFTLYETRSAQHPLKVVIDATSWQLTSQRRGRVLGQAPGEGES
ncbi:MAG: zinc-binding dehydrogenase [Anaerolineae bacterium]|nr:zinc-binding dehydrogenase [Anaerolineae bacterium]